MFPRTLTMVGALALPLAHSPAPDLAVAGPASLHGPSIPGAGTSAAPPVTLELTGRVFESGSRQPVGGAQVGIDGTRLGTLTNANGRYLLRLDDAWAGREVDVVVVHVGHTTARRTVSLGAGANTLDFTLQPATVGLETLVISGDRAPSAEVARAIDLSVAATPFTPYPAPADRESYAFIRENGFLSVENNPLSTFSIDVDRASYSNVRRFINDGMRPPVDAVRIEELVNYFPYADPAPEGDDPFAVTAEVATAPWQPLHQLVRIGLKGRQIDMDEAPPSNLVFLLDVSGSMSSPLKLPLLKQAFSMLVDQLRPRDRVAIVVYAGAAGLVLPSTPGGERTTILDALQKLEAGGSTAGGAGIRLAYRVAADNHIEGGNNRVILATDGDFNVGASSDAEMIRLIEEKRDQGTFLTVLGFGTGNPQDAKMEQIADHGNGNFAYIDGPLEAKKVLVKEMGGTLVTIAKDVKIQVEFNPARVAAYRLIGYENRLLADEDFNDDTKDAGELGAGHSVTALYEIVPVGVESPAEIRDVDPLRYRRNRRPDVLDNEEILFVKLRYKEPDGTESKLVTRKIGDTVVDTSDDFRFAAAVAAWGMLLRNSEHCGDFRLDDVSRLARTAVGADPEGYRADFVSLLDRARSLEVLSMEPGIR